jgi:hypothetical protein
MRNRLTTLLAWVAPWITHDPATLRLVQVAALVVGLFPFVAIGPHVQLYLTSILHASAPTIYGTAYQEQLVDFPTLTEWIKYLSAAWFHWVTAAIVCVAALRCTRARDAFVTAWVAAFIALTAGDLVFGLMCDESSCNCGIVCEEVTGEYVFKNVISNFAGGAILAGVFVALIQLVCITWGWLSRGPTVALILSSIAPIATG